MNYFLLQSFQLIMSVDIHVSVPYSRIFSSEIMMRKCKFIRVNDLLKRQRTVLIRSKRPESKFISNDLLNIDKERHKKCASCNRVL